MMFQHHYQSAIISILNCIFAVLIIYYDNNKSNLLNFMSVSWIIGSFCDNITSYKYHYTIDQYYKMLDRFNMYRRNYSNKSIAINAFSISDNTLQFNNVTFNYIIDLFADVILESKDIIKNLSYTFVPGIYYLESPNGIGKSTFLKSMLYYIKSGSIVIYLFGITINELIPISNFESKADIIQYLKLTIHDFLPSQWSKLNVEHTIKIINGYKHLDQFKEKNIILI